MGSIAKCLNYRTMFLSRLLYVSNERIHVFIEP